MPIVGFNFEKVSVEKKNPIKGKIEIKSNVSITDIKEEKLPTGKTKMDGLRFNFDFKIEYTPTIGEIDIKGHIFFMDDPKVLKDTIKQYKKDKKILPEITTQIINTVLLKSSTKALSLAQEVNLPPHIRLPQISNNADPKNYIG